MKLKIVKRIYSFNECFLFDTSGIYDSQPLNLFIRYQNNIRIYLR